MNEKFFNNTPLGTSCDVFFRSVSAKQQKCRQWRNNGSFLFPVQKSKQRVILELRGSGAQLIRFLDFPWFSCQVILIMKNLSISWCFCLQIVLQSTSIKVLAASWVLRQTTTIVRHLQHYWQNYSNLRSLYFFFSKYNSPGTSRWSPKRSGRGCRSRLHHASRGRVVSQILRSPTASREDLEGFPISDG